jgi:hypothetical protein
VHNEQLRDFYCLANNIRMIKLRTMEWGGSVARVGQNRNDYRVLVGKLES